MSRKLLSLVADTGIRHMYSQDNVNALYYILYYIINYI
jgi:hypothetical protein